MGPTVTRPVQDPLSVLLLDNQLYIAGATDGLLQSITKNACTSM